MKKELFNWLSDSLKKISNYGDVEDIHINELQGVILETQEDYLKTSCSIVKELSQIINEFDLSDVRVDLNIELTESFEMKGRPKSLNNLIKDVDLYSVPELLIYKPTPDDRLTITMIELYRSPVIFKFYGDIGCFKVFYEEYRSYTELNSTELFSRWLSFSYSKE